MKTDAFEVLRNCEGETSEIEDFRRCSEMQSISDRKVIDLFAKQTAMECFSSLNKEQFDQTMPNEVRLGFKNVVFETFRKFGGEE